MANYYPEEIVYPLIVEWNTIEDKQDLRAKEIMEIIFPHIREICIAEIFVHSFQRFENVDDLIHTGLEACLRAIPKFNPEFVNKQGRKARTFDYFSLIAKRSMLFHTLRNKENRLNSSYETMDNLIFTNRTVEDQTTEAIKNVIEKISRLEFSSDLWMVFVEYLRRMGSFKKRDFVRFAEAFGYSVPRIRGFMKELKQYKDEMYSDCQDEVRVDTFKSSGFEEESF